MLLSIDPSIVKTGWAVWQVDGLSKKLIAYGLYTPKYDRKIDKELCRQRRLIELSKFISDTVRQYNITEMTIESQYLGRSVKSMKLLVQARTAMEITALRLDVKVTELHVKQWQSATFGNTKNTKESSLNYANSYLRANNIIETDRDDISDAICMGLYYIEQKSPLCSI